MKKIVINLVRFLLVFYFSSVSLINGQMDPQEAPYKIDIKKNIKNLKAINLSTIGKQLSYIPLETTPECLIQKIRKILFSDSFIFISEYSKLLQFDKNGKFIRQIGSSGTGPGEYISVGDFCIDEQKKEIYMIFSSAPKLLIFGFDGVLKKSINLSFRPAQIISKDKNSLMFHLWNVPGKNDPSWIITNRQGIILTSIKNNLKRISQPGFLVNHTPLYTFDKTLHFMEFGIDTLYYFKDIQRKPYSIFSFGDLKMDTDPIISPSMIKNVDENLNGKLWVGSIIENDDLIFIEFFLGITNLKMCAIYNKTTDSLTFLKDNVFKNDLGGGFGFWPKQIVNDKILIDYVDAFDLIKKVIPSELRNRISETSNPVIIILK
jgi:hypothetical protein